MSENENSFQYGLATLQKMILHTSYNLSFQTWSTTNEEHKLLKERKIMVQRHFRKELDFIIDKPKQLLLMMATQQEDSFTMPPTLLKLQELMKD